MSFDQMLIADKPMSNLYDYPLSATGYREDHSMLVFLLYYEIINQGLMDLVT